MSIIPPNKIDNAVVGCSFLSNFKKNKPAIIINNINIDSGLVKKSKSPVAQKIN